ncbi:hypothetical protein BRADI_1g59223v3 [Brachypodium distachyon]|nr:hypothetical protein BRADI_1g59223v3 [Brachypodium distachyon]
MNGATGLGYRLTCGGEDTTAWLRLCFFCCCCLLAPGRSGQVSQIMQKQRNTFSLSPFAFGHTHVCMNCSPQEWQEMCQTHTKMQAIFMIRSKQRSGQPNNAEAKEHFFFVPICLQTHT